jgi:ribosomal protein S18 acetylase RimI-like enzyme
LNDFASSIRLATSADATAIAELVNIATDGLALFLWTRSPLTGPDPWAFGRKSAASPQGGTSYRNAVLLERDGQVAAGLIGYPLDHEPAPTPEGLQPMVVPLQELEDLVPGTWHINVLAAYPEHRDKGYGTALLGVAERLARASGRHGLSLVVSDANSGARRLYERCGYREAARRRMVKDGWQHPGTDFVLLVKGLAR